MALFYKSIKRGNPARPEVPKKWYLLLKSIGTARTREIARLMTGNTTMNPKEAEMAVSLLVKTMITLLKDGHTVQLDDLGTFFLTATSDPSDTKEEVTAHKARNLRIRFRPDAALREEIKKAQLRPVESLLSASHDSGD
ncbi:MAG: HU family DNA-binding protein [Prevotellaceae bacterium]|jgi:predicted histone-like DNA-binding protein|nr:HU family DNA-binding protein [Prevotellaceae bacterium]